MMKHFSGLVLVLVLDLVQSSASRADTPYSNNSAMVFLKPEATKLGEAIAPPPKAGSPEFKAEFEQLHKWQNDRKKADCDRATSEVTVSLDTFFGPQYGPLSAAEVQEWADFIKKVQQDTWNVTGDAKKFWARPRPYTVDTTLSPCLGKESSAAYPSGHAAIARVMAHVLSKIYPEREASIMARADQVALDRIIGGVHSTADIEAGKKLGDQIFDAMVKNGKLLPAIDSQKKQAKKGA